MQTEPREPSDSLRTIKPSNDLMQRVQAASGAEIGACFGCKKCSNGCPLTFAMDLHPYQVVRYLQLGLEDRLRACRAIWICSTCLTCYTRCPNEVDLPRLMDHLKSELFKQDAQVPEPNTLTFHRLFLREVKAHGRVFEASLVGRYQLATGAAWGPDTMENARLGWEMLKRGRLKLLPSRTKERSWRKRLFKERSL